MILNIIFLCTLFCVLIVFIFDCIDTFQINFKLRQRINELEDYINKVVIDDIRDLQETMKSEVRVRQDIEHRSKINSQSIYNIKNEIKKLEYNLKKEV